MRKHGSWLHPNYSRIDDFGLRKAFAERPYGRGSRQSRHPSDANH
jgi:hypothetical protein